MSALDEIKRDAEGIALLVDWLGDGGKPVTAAQSEHRASVCTTLDLGQPCQLNVEPNWWDRMKNAVAETIRKELAIKRRLNYSTSRDSSLHMCKACGCCLPLKVHVPPKHIRAHTSPEVEAKFPPGCWIKKELSNET